MPVPSATLVLPTPVRDVVSTLPSPAQPKSLFSAVASFGSACLMAGTRYISAAVPRAAVSRAAVPRAALSAPAPVRAVSSIGEKRSIAAPEREAKRTRRSRIRWTKEEVAFVSSWVASGHEGDWLGCLQAGQGAGILNNQRTKVSVKDCARTLREGGYRVFGFEK